MYCRTVSEEGNLLNVNLFRVLVFQALQPVWCGECNISVAWKRFKLFQNRLEVDRRVRSSVCCGRATSVLGATGRSSVPGSPNRSTCPAHRPTTVASTSSPRQRSWCSCISMHPCVTESRASEQTLNIHSSVWRTRATTSTACDD